MAGTVYAVNKSLGFSRLRKNGLQPLELNFNIMASIRGMFSSDFDGKDLARFYNTIGRRIKNGKSIVEGLDSAIEFVQDDRLRQAIMIMKQATIDGQSEYDAMMAGGFPHRDAMVIRSTSQAGKTGESFIALSDEINRVQALHKAVTGIFRMPLIMAGIMYLFFYGTLISVAPSTIKFLKNTNLKISLTYFNQLYFDFAVWFNANIQIGSLFYFSIPLLFIWFMRSKASKKLVEKWKRIKDISTKADQASLWTSFALLYEAAIPVKEACKILADAAKRDDSKGAFSKMGRLINSGLSIEDAIQKAGFPSYIVSGIKASISGGALVEGITDMTKNIEEDVHTMTQLLQENMKLLSLFLVAIGIGFIFFVTYYPIISSVLGNV